MKKLILILSIISLLCVFSCTKTFYIKSGLEYPKTFIVDQNVYNASKNEIKLRYHIYEWGKGEYYEIIIPYRKYRRKDININDTLIIKSILNNKYLKVKK